jgi:hypothetical protein
VTEQDELVHWEALSIGERDEHAGAGHRGNIVHDFLDAELHPLLLAHIVADVKPQREPFGQVKFRPETSRAGQTEITRLDGLSIDYDDWHFNVRPSNTEPLLRLNLEALDPTLMERKRDEVLAVIRGEA